MIGHRVHAARREDPCNRFHLASRGGVHHSRITQALQQPDHRLEPLSVRLHPHDTEREVGTVESAHGEHGVAEGKESRDVPSYARCCRGREGDRLRIPDPPANRSQLEVTRPEVLSPFTDAVRLVDGQQVHTNFRQERRRGPGDQPFRCDVEKLDRSTPESRHASRRLVRRQGAVEVRGRHPTALQRLHLIRHQ